MTSVRHRYKSTACCLAIIACGCFSTTLHYDFPDYAAAAESDVYRNGWLPDTLPKSARNIRVVNDLDVNRVWARFEFDRKEIDGLVRGWDKRRRDSVTFQPQYGSLRTDWWDLGSSDEDQLHYFGKSRDLDLDAWREFLAIDTTRETAWYWAFLDY